MSIKKSLCFHAWWGAHDHDV